MAKIYRCSGCGTKMRDLDDRSATLEKAIEIGLDAVYCPSCGTRTPVGELEVVGEGGTADRPIRVYEKRWWEFWK